MRAKDFITEVFNSDVPGKVIKSTNTHFVTRATIGDRDIKFTAVGESGEWEIGFVEHSAKASNTFSKTGSGNELQVFSFVIESIKLFLSQYSPDAAVFTSDKSDVNRSALYAKMAKRIKVPGYKVIQEPAAGSYDLFKIVRDTPGT